jgi:hypothetical protein
VRIPPLGRSGSSENKHGSIAKISSLYEKYRDKEVNNGEDAIQAVGVEALCKDLELRPDEFKVLVLAWKCNAEQVKQNELLVNWVASLILGYLPLIMGSTPGFWILLKLTWIPGIWVNPNPKLPLLAFQKSGTL